MPPPPKPPAVPASELLTGAALWAERPPLEWLISEVIPVGSLTILCAYGSTYKTWLLLQMGLSVAGGSPWLGRPTSRARALFVDYESGDYETHRRIRGLSPEPLDGFTMWTMPTLALTDPKFEGALSGLTTSEGYRLVLIDSLSAGSRGNFSENDSRFAAPLIALKKLAAHTGVAVVILHHSRKQRQEGGQLEAEADPRMAARGTGAIYAAADSMWSLSKGEDDSVSVVHTKARNGKELSPFHVKLLGGPDSPEGMRWEVTTEKDRKNATFLKASKTLLDLIRRKPGLSGNELLKLLGGKREAHFKTLKRLESEGIVRHERDGYYLAGSLDLEPGAEPPNEVLTVVPGDEEKEKH